MLVELHCHSNFSDGCMLVKDIFDSLKSKNIGAIAITDHDTFGGYKEAKKIAKNYETILIPGIELSVNEGHVLILGIDEFETRENMCAMNIIDIINSNGGLGIIAHPFGNEAHEWTAKDEITKKFNALEVLNGTAFPESNRVSFNLAKKLGMPMTSGSDAHRLEEIGEYACEIDANSVDEILEKIIKGKVKIPNKKTNASVVISNKLKRKMERLIS